MATVHFTPSQVRLILNGYIIDEAHGIDYDIMDERTPLFGFRDRTFADISVGRTLVYGNLYINFVYKGYLLQAIAHTKNKVTEQAFRKAVASGRSGDYPKNMLVARPGSLTTPFDLTIAYGMEADNPMYNEVIQDVYIKGQSKVIRASVAGAEDILLERYQFVARTIV